MAETLGSLVDKLTIKDLRKYHLTEMLNLKDGKFSDQELKSKIDVVCRQKTALISEIDAFINAAMAGGIPLKDEKVKLYNAADAIGRIPATDSLGGAVSGLAQKNLELWHLEDEARRKDVTLDVIGQVKRKIDLVNQQRNDYIDKIDELFEKKIREKKKD
jgi:ribonuclease PH